MSGRYCYEYPRPAVTVDLVVFAFDPPGMKALFIRRKSDPFAGRWAIPGGFVEIDEPIEAAARRELREETGLEASGPVAMIGVFADPGRDPRGRTISLAHATVVAGPPPEVLGGDDAAEAAWLDPRAPIEPAFDHAAILESALTWLAHEVRRGDLALSLLPRTFDDDQVKALFRALGLTGRAVVSWRARMLREGRITPDARRGGRFRALVRPRSR